ncbi:MAG: amidase domain-containing protein, partial [Candidatus Delongbacteria bacterium]|nr:amidase domain-containing protein [Candidatus Delongbacteria bacterium]MCG2759644.1 amidase domain-containing protein [Candidatus Delongbacteria bacterium]
MYLKILVAFLLILMLSPISAMSDDGGNVPVVQKKGTVNVFSQDSQHETSESKDIEQSEQASAMEVKQNEEKITQKESKSRSEIYSQIISLPPSSAKINLNNIMVKISRSEELKAEEIYELGRPNFRGKLKESLVFIELVLGYEFSTPEAIKEAMLGVLNISSNKKLYKVDEHNELFEKHKEQLFPKLRYVLNSDYQILVIRAASMLILLGEDKKEFISIFEEIVYGKDQKNWNFEATTLFGDDKLYLSYIRRGFDINDIKESAVDEIRMESFVNLFNTNKELALKAANYILSQEGDYSAKRNQIDQLYKLLPTRIKNFLKKYDSKEDEGNLRSKILKYTTTNSNEIWSPDSSAAYCVRFVGDSLGTYSDEGYNTLYHNHTDTGSDCANFGTQCLKHGGLNFTNANAPINYVCTYNGNTDGNICICDNQHAYLNNRQDIMVTSSVIENSDEDSYVPDWLRIGDIAIVGNNDNDKYQHTIIKHYDDGTDSFFGAHTNNRISLKLSSFVTTVITGWNHATFYHIIGSTVLKNPDKDSLTVQLGDSLNLQAIVTNNTEPTSLNPITNFKYILKKKPENTTETLYETTDAPPAADSTYVFDFETALQDTGRYILYAKTTYTEGITQDSCILKIKPVPEVIYPTPDDIILIKPPGKAIATDTLDIKIRVPEVLGSYPNIKLKIDGVYVEQSDIVLEDSIYVYPWILNTVTSDPLGKRIKIEPELFDDPYCSTTSDILTVQAVFLETFLGMTDLISDGWTQEGTGSTPGWIMGPDPFDFPNKCARSYSIVNSKAFYLMLRTPSFTVPDSSVSKTKLEYKLYFWKNNSPNSYIYFDVCDESGTPLTTTRMLGPAYGIWTYMNYDLSGYSNQTIKLRWNHNYTNGIEVCNATRYAIENVAVYAIPDMD